MRPSLPVSAPEFATGGMADCTAAKVRRLARRVTQIYDEGLAPHGLTVGQFGLLACLRRREGVGVGALAERLGADASTVARLLKPLRAADLLVIVPDSSDRRAKSIRLTDTGAAKLRAAAAGWGSAQARVRAALGEGRLASLHFTLDDARAYR